MRIIFTGGGTGGHLFPIIAIARELKRLHPKDDIALHYIGPKDELGGLLLSHENITSHHIAAGKIRRYFSFQNIIDAAFKIPFSFLQSIFLLLKIHPKLVFSKGGTGSLPVTMAARILGIPVFLHESDIAPGKSNRVASKWAKKVFIAFEKTEYFDLAKTTLVGNPIKTEMMEGNVEGAKELFNLSLQKPVILFLGGSQGAQAINNFILITVNDLLKEFEVIHVCGKKNYQDFQTELSSVLDKNLEPYYHLYSSLDEIPLKHAYKVADLIVSRSGAASIFEIAANGKPSILIPLPSAAANHQTKNAYEYAQTGAAIIVEQDNVTPHFFLGKMHFLLSDPTKLQAMKTAALTFAKPLAAKAIAREILEFLGNSQ